MTDPGFVLLDAWMVKALTALAPAERRTLFRRIGRVLVKRNRAHIARQIGPDGAAWAPRRRDNHGQVRKTVKMMTGLRAARRLKVTATAEGAEVGWSGRDARIASVHQLGGLDYIDRATSDTKVRYPARPLIGLTPEDVALLRDTLLSHLSSHL